MKTNLKPLYFDTRYCSKCKKPVPLDLGGEWETFNNGRNRRWVCAPCKPPAGNIK